MQIQSLAEIDGIPVIIVSRGHFPNSVIVREIQSQLKYEVELHKLKFKE